MQLSPEQVQATNVLLSGCQVAQRRGAFSLQEAQTLQGAIDALVPREEQDRQMQEALEAARAEQSGELSEGSVEDEAPVEDEVVEESSDDSEDEDVGDDSEEVGSD